MTNAACPACGEAAPADSRFCRSCGRALVPAVGLAAQARYATPATYTPPHLVERILRHRSAIEGEHKRVTVLFCDLVGSTELAERLGPERMHALLNRFFEMALDEVHRYEGTVNQFLGDGFMALFGAPLALEQHERQAALAALGMQRAVAEQLREVAGPLLLRMGLNSGNVVVGKIGDNLRMDYTAVGDITNVAARLQTAAAPGEILVAADTWDRARRVALAEPVGPVAVKGRRDGVEAYRLVGRRAAHPGESAIEDRRLSPFVARSRELAGLHDALAEAEAGRGVAVGIVGDPGLGKSRLLYEFRRSLADRRVTYLEGHCVSFGTAIPYLPVLELLRGNCDIEDIDTPERVAAKVSAVLAEVGLETSESLPYLLHLLGVKEGGPLDSLSPETIKARTFEALRQLSVRGSQRRPLILVVEDLHWIDEASEAFLESVVESLPGAAILFIATYRPGYRPEWIGRGYVSQLSLRPLNEQDGRAIVQATLAGAELSKDITATILQRGEGNPFFLEELSRTVSGPDAGATTAEAIPGTLQGLLMARIDRLPDDTKRLLQIAAVVGREFSAALVASVRAGHPMGAGADPALTAELRELVRHEFIFERARGDEFACAFKHALTRDVVYASLLETQRRVYHGAVAEALETLHGARPEPVLELLANHFLLSAHDDRAVDYALRAAEKAQKRWANSEAIGFSQAALSRLDTMPDTQENRWRRIDAVLLQAEVRFALGQHADQLERLEAIGGIVEQAADPRRRAAWHYWVGFLHCLTGSRPEVAIEHCERAAEIARAHGAREIEDRAQSCLAQVYLFAGNLRRALAIGEDALSAFEARGDLWWACRTLAQLSPAANAMGEWERSLGYCRRAVAHANALDDRRLKIAWLGRLGSALVQRGDGEGGLARCDEALAMSPGPFDRAVVETVRGCALGRMGAHADAVAVLEETHRWFERSGLAYTQCQVAQWLGEALLRVGDRARAQTVLEATWSACHRLGYEHLEAVAGRLLAEAIAPAAEADRLVARSLEVLEAIGARNEVGRAHVLNGLLLHGRGDSPGARAGLMAAVAIFDQLGTADEARRARDVLASLDDRRG